MWNPIHLNVSLSLSLSLGEEGDNCFIYMYFTQETNLVRKVLQL